MDFVFVASYINFIKHFFCGLLSILFFMAPANLSGTTKKKLHDKKEFIQPEKPFLSLTEFKIPIFHSLHPYHTVTINCTLEVQEDSWVLAKFNVPYIYHYIFKDLYYALNFLWCAHEPPNKDTIKKRMLYVYKKHFTHKWPITDIHINSIKVQK
ncbi:MAG: hypothetical protein COY39_04950 [Alphaproteobacteria bacterium CG_4_10_14_0_8_um_filter_37_21]|nr:MAG: hypothetical protein COY39_04950 [Alphaproteobacteria bacterium CG_4_10_14_0_8_um_filter_37_21]